MDLFVTTNRVVEWKTVHLIQSCKDLEIFWHFVVSKGLCLQLPSRTAKHNRCRVDMQKQNGALKSRKVGVKFYNFYLITEEYLVCLY